MSFCLFPVCIGNESREHWGPFESLSKAEKYRQGLVSAGIHKQLPCALSTPTSCVHV